MLSFSAQYLAGVLDSDGSLTITKRHCYRINCNYTCMIQLTWTLTKKSKEFVETLVEYYGGSYFIGLPSGAKQFKNCKEVVKYCATGKAAEAIARDTRKYLILKRDQAENIIAVREAVRVHKSNRPQKVTDFLESLYLKNKKLNRKNTENDCNTL